MTRTKRPSVYLFGTLVLALVGVFAATPAESRSPSCSDSLRDSARRVIELEAEVRALREQLRSGANCPSDPLPKLVRSSSRQVPAISSKLHGRRRANPTGSESCDPPFRFDRRGIKFYNSDCLGSEEAPCATPYGYTATGIKYYDARCLPLVSERTACDPPFEVDAKGLRRIRAECL